MGGYSSKPVETPAPPPPPAPASVENTEQKVLGFLFNNMSLIQEGLGKFTNVLKKDGPKKLVNFLTSKVVPRVIDGGQGKGQGNSAEFGRRRRRKARKSRVSRKRSRSPKRRTSGKRKTRKSRKSRKNRRSKKL
jgi:hypothetical protein